LLRESDHRQSDKFRVVLTLVAPKLRPPDAVPFAPIAAYRKIFYRSFAPEIGNFQQTSGSFWHLISKRGGKTCVQIAPLPFGWACTVPPQTHSVNEPPSDLRGSEIAGGFKEADQWEGMK